MHVLSGGTAAAALQRLRPFLSGAGRRGRHRGGDHGGPRPASFAERRRPTP
jgi:hypothetical protein